SYQTSVPAAPDTRSEMAGVVGATTGAGTDGGAVDQGVTTAAWRGMSSDGTNAEDTRVAQQDAAGGRQVDQEVSAADWHGMSADGTSPADTQLARQDAAGGRQVSGTIGSAALAGAAVGRAAVGRAAGQSPAQQDGPGAVGREVTANGRRYVIYGDEVRTGGSVSWRARNPGNIRHGAQYGAVPGARARTPHSGTFAIFPDEPTRMAAITPVLRG